MSFPYSKPFIDLISLRGKNKSSVPKRLPDLIWIYAHTGLLGRSTRPGFRRAFAIPALPAHSFKSLQVLAR